MLSYPTLAISFHWHMSDDETAAVIPLLPAKQRVTSPNDWMTTDALIACPDPNCPSQLRITREGIRSFNHSETTVVPLHHE